MTIKVTIPQANQQFSQLMESVLQGEEIIICEDNDQSVPIARIAAIYPAKKNRIPGQDRGKVIISPDFNQPLPDDILTGLIDNLINNSIPKKCIQ
jgi:antitoxin (DNA-binding transcriptional repressor) of toxin-antitoxin stability system